MPRQFQQILIAKPEERRPQQPSECNFIAGVRKYLEQEPEITHFTCVVKRHSAQDNLGTAARSSAHCSSAVL